MKVYRKRTYNLAIPMKKSLDYRVQTCFNYPLKLMVNLLEVVLRKNVDDVKPDKFFSR